MGGSDWRVGVVVQRWYESPDYPPGTCSAYAVTLDETVGGTAKVNDALDASTGKLRDGQVLIMVPRDEPRCCVHATGRIGGRQSILEALADMHITGRQSMLHVLMAQLDLPALLALHYASQCTSRHARRVLNSWRWLQSADGVAAVRSSALGISCASSRQGNGIPRSWWVVPRGSKSRDTLCWGWRTNLEQAVKRGDAEMVRVIARTAPDAETTLFRHACDVHLFAETQMLLQRACTRAHIAAAEAVFDSCFVRVDAQSLKDGPGAWRRLAQGRGWAGETEMLGCCYKVGSPVLQHDDVADGDEASQSDLDATAEMLLRHGASPMALGGQKRVSPLFMAALNANARLVRAFVAAGADPDAPIGDGTGSTPRSACRSCFEETGSEEYAPVVEMLDQASRALEAARKRNLPAEAWATLDAICEDAYEEGVLPAAMPRGFSIEDPAQRRLMRRAAVDRLTDKRMSTMASSDTADRNAESYKMLVSFIERVLRTFAAVRVTGLTGKPDLNGQIGELAGDCTGEASRGDVRYPVRIMSTGEASAMRVVRVKAQNLRGCAAVTSAIDEQD